jgi:hypothetical protein
MNATEDEIGPVDVVVIGYPPGAPARGDSVPILLDLVDRGIIRVFDALFVRKAQDGAISRFDLGDVNTEMAGDLTALAGASTGLLDDDDAARVAAEIEPGAAAVAIVYENRWAAPFVASVRRNGGTLITNQRVGAEELLAALDAAEARA